MTPDMSHEPIVLAHADVVDAQIAQPKARRWKQQ
jgi:hypothetical protein